MELRQIEYVTTLARFLNFHRAAAELGVTQPALSIQLKKLETELGVSLVDRDTRRVRMTEVGQTFADRMQPLLAEMKAISTAMSELSTISGAVIVGSGVLGTLRLPALVNAFADRYPKVDLILRQQPPHQTAALLASGEVDVGVLLVYPQSWQAPAGVVLEYKARVPVGVLMRSNHRLASHTEVTLRDLVHERLIVSSSASSAPRLAIDSAIHKSGFAPQFTPSETMTSAISALVSQGLGLGVTTEATAKGSAHRLLFRKLSDVEECSIALAWAKERPRTPAMQAFLEYLRSWPWDDR